MNKTIEQNILSGNIKSVKVLPIFKINGSEILLTFVLNFRANLNNYKYICKASF